MSDNPRPQVVLAYCHNGSTRTHFTECYADLRVADMRHRQLLNPYTRPIVIGGVWLHKNRNKICQTFLQGCTEPWLMFLDTDMLFNIGVFYQLYDQAVARDVGIHAGLYYDAQLRPTWAKLHKTHVEYVTDRRNGVRSDLDGVGMGFTLVHRDVIAAIAAKNPKRLNAWFGYQDMTDPLTGEIDDAAEDYTFCQRAKALGYKIYGHDNVCLGHDKSRVITWETFDNEYKRIEKAA